MRVREGRRVRREVRGWGRQLARSCARLVDGRRGTAAFCTCGRDGDSVRVVLRGNGVAGEIVEESGLGWDGDVDRVQ